MSASVYDEVGTLLLGEKERREEEGEKTAVEDWQ